MVVISKNCYYLMKTITTTIALLGFIFMINPINAQNYFYLDNVSIAPSNPTPQDEITVTISGFKSDPCSFLNDNYQIEPLGSVLSFYMNWTSETVLNPDIACPLVQEPFDTTFTVGMLSEGNYNISFNGPNYNFSSVEGDLNFTVALVGNVELLEDLKVKLYPNPVMDFLYLENQDGVIEQVDIFDFSGKMVTQLTALSEGIHKIDLLKLRPGIYNVMIRKAGGLASHKLCVFK